MRLTKTSLTLLSGAVFGVLAANLFRPVAADAPKAFAREEPIYRSLDANLAVQTSAEYRACCLQAYNLATCRLNEKLAGDPKFPNRPAVILDLDETVFDNSGFQAVMARSGLTFDQRLFDWWEDSQGAEVELVPGALDFIQAAKAKKVEICYITNRRNHTKTMDVLVRLGLEVPADQLKVNTEKKSSNKQKRRDEVAEKFTVVMLVGDNLRDFDEVFKFPDPELMVPAAKSIPARAEAVDKNKAKFGVDWIILPNPMYGEWMKPFGHGTADLDFLRPVRVPKD